MTTELRRFYEKMGKQYDTHNQQFFCRKFLDGLRSNETPDWNLAQWFHDALAANCGFANIDQPFLNERSIQVRKPIGPDSRGDNGIIYLLSIVPDVRVHGLPDYDFQYVERQVPPMRIEEAGDPTSGAGGIDYTAHATCTPILGEVKRHSDQNPFYAFIQLLTYLSEIATPNQIARANRHRQRSFGVDIGHHPGFDLHILLADFNDRGEKGKLIEPTQQLAAEFKARLRGTYPHISGVVGKIMCLTMNTQEWRDGSNDLGLHWLV